MQQCFSLLKKQKKQFWIFQKEQLKYYDDINFSQKLLLTDTKVSEIRKAFANGSLANTKLSRTQLSKIVQLGGILCDITIFGNIL